MPNVQATPKQHRRARIAAAITVSFVALFAFAFVGVIVMLNDYADSLRVEEEIPLASEAPTDPFYVLLIGSDSRRGTAMYTGKANEHAQVDQHADIMTLMRIDPLEHLITLVTIPRDVVLDGHTEKINSALANNDPEAVVDVVGELTGIRADYYMMTSFIAFENLVNAVGGIDVYVPKTITVSDPATGKNVTVKAGKSRHLDGSKALVLARARKEYGDDQDAKRQVNVRNIEQALINKVLAMDSGFDVEHILAALEDDTKTNMDLPTVGLLMLDFVEHADEVKLYSGTGPYAAETRDGDGAVIVAENASTWKQLMNVVDDGGDPNTVVKPPSF